MKINTQKPKLAKQLAGNVPDGAKIIGIIDDMPGRNFSVLIKHRTGTYATQINGVSRSIDSSTVRKATQ